MSSKNEVERKRIQVMNEEGISEYVVAESEDVMVQYLEAMVRFGGRREVQERV